MKSLSTPWFPIFLRLRGQAVLVVGGGEVALRKIRLLLTAGAQIRVAARELHAELQALRDAGELAYCAAEFEPAQLDGCRLAIAATSDRQLNRAVAVAADARGIPVNVVDDPEPSSFITPAIIHRAPVQIAISTGGAAPVLARRLREKLETLLPTNYGRIAAFMGRMRGHIKDTQPQAARRGLWETFM
ncbi:MAG: precorrin-2 dehydrogenase/sirohydrochlorin ferrochelatase family protein, partial [Stenotrophobium sp.]